MKLDQIVIRNVWPGILAVNRPVIGEKGEASGRGGTVAVRRPPEGLPSHRAAEATQQVSGGLILCNDRVMGGFLKDKHQRFLPDSLQALMQAIGRTSSATELIKSIDMNNFHGLTASMYNESGL